MEPHQRVGVKRPGPTIEQQVLDSKRPKLDPSAPEVTYSTVDSEKIQQEVLEKQLVDKIKPMKLEQFEKSIEMMLHLASEDKVLSLKNLS